MVKPDRTITDADVPTIALALTHAQGRVLAFALLTGPDGRRLTYRPTGALDLRVSRLLDPAIRALEAEWQAADDERDERQRRMRERVAKAGAETGVEG